MSSPTRAAFPSCRSCERSSACLAFPRTLTTFGCASIARGDRKSTRLNSSHLGSSYAAFCLKKKMDQPGSAFHADSSAYGGIQCGLSNGQPVTVRVLFKPPSTLGDHARQSSQDRYILLTTVP